MLSILIPVSRGGEFLFEAVQSVLAQTWTDWDCWILLNGEGLHAPTQAVAEALAALDSRIHLLPSNANNKCEALNAAIPHTTRPWIALLDVDDRWHPTKLAKQVAALQGVAAGATVIGTHATYFGGMQGSPQLPTGWIDPSLLASVNPLINSSVLLRRDIAQWSYAPVMPTEMEDYYLWMRLAHQGHCFYNIGEPLTEHRIHAQSTFNSRQTSPAALQAWFTGGPSVKPRDKVRGPLRILTIATSQPAYIRAQVAALRRYITEPFTFLVFNDGKAWADPSNFGNPHIRSEITATCRELGVPCLEIPNDHHRGLSSPSARHCDSLRFVMDFIRSAGPARYWMLDSDMFPVRSISSEELDGYFTYGSFVRQVRTVGDQEIVYAWPNLWWLDTGRVDPLGLCWDLAPCCDTGGASASWIRSHSVQWISHLPSGTWGLAQLPTSLQSHSSLVQLLTEDPRCRTQTKKEFECELYEGWILHLRAGSNWREEGIGIHSTLSGLVGLLGV